MEGILKQAIEKNASDIFIIAGLPICFKIEGMIEPEQAQVMKQEEIKAWADKLYILAKRKPILLERKGDDDFSLTLDGIGRFRINVYKQQGSYAIVLRQVKVILPQAKGLGIPDSVLSLGKVTKGLILITGPAGSGKSTTLACIIDQINRTRRAHIITLEDPIEFVYQHKNSIISQREIGVDTPDYKQGLKAALRESPDVILVGEMRDFETIRIAMTAAETGHLILATLHTLGVSKSIDRIIDVFPTHQQQQIRTQISMTVQGIVSQQLIPTEQGLVPAFEIMMGNTAIRNMIRESKIHQIDAILSSYTKEGMRSMDHSLIELYEAGRITAEQAIFYSSNPEIMHKAHSRF